MTRRAARRRRVALNRHRRTMRYRRVGGPRVGARRPRKPRLTYATLLAALEAIKRSTCNGEPAFIRGHLRVLSYGGGHS